MTKKQHHPNNQDFSIQNEFFNHSILLGLITKKSLKTSQIIWLINKTLDINLLQIDNKNRFQTQHTTTPQPHDSDIFPTFLYKDLYHDFSVYLITNQYKDNIKIIQLKNFPYLLFFKTTQPSHQNIFNTMSQQIQNNDNIIRTFLLNINDIQHKGYFIF